jgi:transcriptional regulator GlxA family with amidase domain
MMEQVLAVRRMQDHIQAPLTEEITMADLAGAAHCLPCHACRLFRLHTSLTPAAYIARLRRSESAMCLRNENCSATDVVIRMGFKHCERQSSRFFSCLWHQPPRSVCRKPTHTFKPFKALGYIELRPIKPSGERLASH